MELIGIEPTIWRRIVVPSNIKLSKRNHVIQESMSWTNSHLHRFASGNTEYTGVEFELDIEHEDESRGRLADLLPHPPSVLLYEYDFGDPWDHVVIVEEYWRGDRDAALSLCVDGARACTPEELPEGEGSIQHRERLGGILNHDYREAA